MLVLVSRLGAPAEQMAVSQNMTYFEGISQSEIGRESMQERFCAMLSFSVLNKLSLRLLRLNIYFQVHAVPYFPLHILIYSEKQRKKN